MIEIFWLGRFDIIWRWILDEVWVHSFSTNYGIHSIDSKLREPIIHEFSPSALISGF